MVQGFAAQSGGTVRIRSKPGEGTIVELWLPRAAVPASGEIFDRSEAPAIGSGTASILLCDDDDEVRRALCAFLRSLGYIVREANGGTVALRMLEGWTDADLLVVDYAMPGINGLETIRQARRRRPDLRSLLITGYARLPGKCDVPLLRKPFTPRELSVRIAEILAA